MSRTSTISSCSASKTVVSTSSGRCRSPANCSAYIRATRAGVSTQPVPLRVLADGEQYLADRALDPRLVDRRLLASRDGSACSGTGADPARLFGVGCHVLVAMLSAVALVPPSNP